MTQIFWLCAAVVLLLLELFSALYQHIYKKHKEVGIIKNRGNSTAATTLSSLPLDLSSTVNCTETLECSKNNYLQNICMYILWLGIIICG